MLVDSIKELIEFIGQIILYPLRIIGALLEKWCEKGVSTILCKYSEWVENLKKRKHKKIKNIAVNNQTKKETGPSKALLDGAEENLKQNKVPAIKWRIRFHRPTWKIKFPHLPQFPWKLIFGFLLGIIFTVIFVIFPLTVRRWFQELPNPDLLVIDASRRSTKILDRNGQLLYEIYVDRNFDPVRLNQIPDNVKNATIAAEDENFYSHWGIDLKGIARAARETILNKNLQGGSTITQQLIKNVLLSPERTVSRKLKEIVLALWVETKYTKDQILEMYLNNTPYGGTAWGIETASNKYFGKNVWELDLAEAALLAGLPSSPSTYSPLTNINLAKERQKYVLDKMIALKFITQDQEDRAYAENLNIIGETQFIRAPHFVDYVRGELERLYGKRMVELGGLTVTTSLDLNLQEKVQNIVTDEVTKNGLNLNFSNGAAVVIDPKTSQILAYVGSIDYFQPGWGAYDVLTANRQPGSSIKPVTYSLALSDGYTLSSTIKDEPVTFPQIGGPPYTPVNYDGKFHGEVTLRQALANSFNVPAVKLASALGPDNIVSLGHEMGLNEWAISDKYGLSVTLGGKEVMPLELANVYATLARKGVYQETTPIISVKDNQGYEVYSRNSNERRAISEEVSYLIWSVLIDNNARTLEFGPNSYLVVPGYTVAAKTGTTNDKKDNWTLGFTPSYVVGVWVGNNDGSPMNYYLASGLSGAAPIWNKIFQTVLLGRPNETYPMPSGVINKYDDKCKKSEYFVKGSNIPASLCPQDNKKTDKKKK